MSRLMGLLTAAVLAASVAVPGAVLATAGPIAVPLVVVGPVVARAASQPPTSAECQTDFGIACYGPPDIQNQYDVTALLTGTPRIDGGGQTIVIFDAYGSPTIAQDLTTFDTAYGLPAPPSFQVYMPEGNVRDNYTKLPSPAFMNKRAQNQIGWAYETTLDVEWAHAIAPGASIALVVTPTAETQGVQGIPSLQNAQQWALSNHIGMIWSNSWSTTEQSFHSTASIGVLDRFYAQAAAQGVSAFFATGDSGVANTDKQGRLYPYPTVTYPPSSANVIAVGGTEIPTPVDTITTYQPEAEWNDGYGAGGGGYSVVFAEPSYQSGATISDPTGMRGVPDVSMNAALISSVLIYESFDPQYGAGWTLIGGTSAATPQWAAVAALANQYADRALGFLAPRLYQIYTNGSYASAFHDITVGDNSFGGITGYSAGSGWDAATGLGTPDVANLVAALKSTSP